MFDGMFVVSYDCLGWGCLWLIALKFLVTCCGCGGLSGLGIRVWKMGKACSNLCMYVYIYIYTVTALLEVDQRPDHLGNMDLKSFLAMNQSDSIAVVLFFPPK